MAVLVVGIAVSPGAGRLPIACVRVRHRSRLVRQGVRRGCHVRPAQQVGAHLLRHAAFQVVVIGRRGCNHFIPLKEKMATSLQSKDRNQEAACIFIVR